MKHFVASLLNPTYMINQSLEKLNKKIFLLVCLFVFFINCDFINALLHMLMLQQTLYRYICSLSNWINKSQCWNLACHIRHPQPIYFLYLLTKTSFPPQTNHSYLEVIMAELILGTPRPNWELKGNKVSGEKGYSAIIEAVVQEFVL